MVCFATLAGCGATSGIDGSQGAKAYGIINVVPGQTGDFTAWLVNNSGHAVTIESASLLPESGFRLPGLVGAAIEPGRQFLGAARSWPPPLPVKPLHGFRLQNQRRIQILYAISEHIPGNYASRGINVGIRAGSTTRDVAAISEGAICVVKSADTQCGKVFEERFIKHVTDAL